MGERRDTGWSSFFPDGSTTHFPPHLNDVWSGFFDWAALFQESHQALQKYDPILGFSGMWLHKHVTQSVSTYRFQWLPECMLPAWGVCCRVFPEYSNNWGIDESWDIPMHIVINVISHYCVSKIWQIHLELDLDRFWRYLIVNNAYSGRMRSSHIRTTELQYMESKCGFNFFNILHTRTMALWTMLWMSMSMCCSMSISSTIYTNANMRKV